MTLTDKDRKERCEMSSARTSGAAAAVVAVAVTAIVAASPAAYAADPGVKTLYVATTGEDNGNTCSAPSTPCRHLYYAIDEAAGYTGDAVTIVAAAGTYRENDEIDTSSLASLTIKAGQGTVTVEGVRRTQASVFTVSGSTVVLDGLTITNGDTDTGGAIDNAGGTVTLNSSTVTGNTARGGAGIYNDGGTLTLNSSTISHNVTKFEVGEGGGVYNFGGNVTLTRSAVTDNTASYVGGGIYNNGGTMTVTDSTVTGNSAAATPGSGGGIYQAAGTATTLTRTEGASHSPDDCAPAELCP